MNDHRPDATPDPGDPHAADDGAADDRTVDDGALGAELTAAGDELRRTARPVEGHEAIAGALRRKVVRARRTNWLVAAVATLVVAGSLGAAVRDTDPASVERAGDPATGGEPSGLTSAEAVVAALPPEPLDPRDVQLIASVSRYDTCDGLLEQLHQVGAAHVGSRGFGGTAYGPYPDAAGYRLAADEQASLSATPASGTTGVSGGETLGTNVIVAGVDEPDTVKATGSLVVELAGSLLRIIDTSAGGIVGTLALGERSADGNRNAFPSSLIVDGQRVVVFGNESVAAEPIPGDPSAARPTHDYLTVTFVDLADPAAPTVTDRVRIEGGMVAVRRVGEQIRMVTSSSLADLPIVYPTTPNSVAPALEQNRLAVAGSSVDDWIPEWDRGDTTPPEPLMGCEGVVVPDTFAGVQLTSLVEFDVDGPFEPRATGLLAPSEQLTATATDVVVASQVWVDPIDRKDDFSDWSTALHRFEFDEAGPRYLASGAVDGSIRDEFSLSVLADGTVGAVTVDVLPWQSREEADVTVRLFATDGASERLDQVGSLVPEASGIAAAGVRFIGDRLLIASGFAGNLLSAVDLTDRAAPRDLGSVAMPGAGAYLHPVAEHRVLVIGPTVRMEGETLIMGFHASLLDLAAAPAVLDSWAKDDLGSSAAYDHHAFTWWAGRSLAAFGVRHETRQPNAAPPPPDAAFLGIEGDAVVPRLVTPREADLGPRCLPLQVDRSSCDDTGHPEVQRVLVVDGSPWLYTSESLEHLDATTFGSVGVVPLRRPLF